MLRGMRPSLMGSCGARSSISIQNRNPIVFEFNNNLNNTGTDAWAATFLNPVLNGASYSTTAKTGTHSLSISGNAYASCTSFTNDFLSLSNQDFSFELDVYFNSLASPPYTFFGKHTGGSGYSFMCIYSDSVNKMVWVKNGIYTTINTTIAINLSTWYNLKIVRSGNTTYFYWDNILAGTYDETISRNGNVNYNANATPLWIGRNGDGAWSFNGLIDNFKFYKRAIL